jgi:hypothetical protein
VRFGPSFAAPRLTPWLESLGRTTSNRRVHGRRVTREASGRRSPLRGSPAIRTLRDESPEQVTRGLGQSRISLERVTRNFGRLEVSLERVTRSSGAKMWQNAADYPLFRLAMEQNAADDPRFEGSTVAKCGG